MPSVTLTNGRDPVSGISFRKVSQDDSDLGKNGGPYARDDITAIRNHYNAVNGVKRSSSDKRSDPSSVEVIRMRLKKGRADGANRNGYVYGPGIPIYNNNGPLKAFPMNNNTMHNGTDQIAEANKNNSSLPNSRSEVSSLASSNGSSPETAKVSSPRAPLHRLNGRGQHQKQHLPPGLTQPLVRNGSNGTIPPANGQHKTALSNVSTTSPQSVARPASPLKSALHKTAPGANTTQPKLRKEAVTFAEYNLPAGMQELHQECFRPGAKACFQHETDIPLLVSTDAAILKRRSSISKVKKNRVTVAAPEKEAKSKINQTFPTSSAEDTPTMLRSRSSASEVFVQPDMQILKACWNIILSFMGDDKNAFSKNQSVTAIVSPRKKYFGHSRKLWRKSSADIGTAKPSSPTMPSPIIYGEAGSRHSMFVPSSPDTSHKKSTPKHHSSSSLPHSKNLPPSVSSLSVLEKVHFLVNVGLSLPYLRDEIYCLVMKQLVNNPSALSSALGWILFALITGSFPPSQKILFYVQKFIDHHQHAWSKYCGERLRRSVENGPRTNPPCSLEIQAAKSTERILFPVICMDNSAMTVTVDPATTSKEMLESMTGKSRIGDPFGYCIVLQSGNKTINLGSGRFPVMDALSQVEIFAGRKFSKSPCRLYYRRDIFSPRDLFRSSDDGMALRLTFFQVCGGIKTGEYFCRKAPDLSLLVAHQYCIQYGVRNIDEKRVAKFCEKCLPSEVYKTNKKSWSKMVTNTIHALGRKQTHAVNPIDIMAQVIQYAMQNLSTDFVRTYRIMTFAKIGGVCTYTRDLSLSLSHKGVAVRQGNAMRLPDRANAEESDVVADPIVLMEIPAENLKRVKLDPMRADGAATLTIVDCVGGSYEITSGHGSEIYSVLFRYIRDITTGADKESNA